LAKDDSHSCIGDVNYSDAGLVNIDDLIESLIELRKGSNYVACDWHCDHSELEVHGFNFRKSTDDEVKVEEEKLNLKQFVGKKEELRFRKTNSKT
jgi:hypothetical protein